MFAGGMLRVLYLPAPLSVWKFRISNSWRTPSSGLRAGRRCEMKRSASICCIGSELPNLHRRLHEKGVRIKGVRVGNWVLSSACFRRVRILLPIPRQRPVCGRRLSGLERFECASPKLWTGLFISSQPRRLSGPSGAGGPDLPRDTRSRTSRPFCAVPEMQSSTVACTPKDR
jgi:hypothetical protein